MIDFKQILRLCLLSILLPGGFLFASEGQEFECSNNRFAIEGSIAKEKMNLSILDEKSYVADGLENFEFTPTKGYENEFPSGSTFEAWTPDYFLALNLPKRVFSSKVKKEFTGKFLTLFEGFRPSYQGTLNCKVLN